MSTAHREEDRRGRYLLVGLLLGASMILGSCSQEQSQSPGAGSDPKEEAFFFGEPAPASTATRRIEVSMLDALKFDPASIEVRVGEVVTFVVKNVGQLEHEFVLGDEKVQKEHEEEHQAGGEAAESDPEPHAIEAKAGETKELTWKFTKEGRVLYGCHEPGHYQGGMVGTITIRR